MSERQGFFQRKPIRRALYHWLERHQHPFNRGIHMIGIPLALGGVVLIFAWWDEWYWGILAFVLGYVLQWIGHLVEGNDLGEWAGIKRLLGLPYVSISPRWKSAQENASPPPQSSVRP
ncbi:MAG TPA: DUF962 domain-containing protein [Gemmataceae bacterium]|nr:DUF962 domain-containing protein [Gemmataceae bacterium]